MSVQFHRNAKSRVLVVEFRGWRYRYGFQWEFNWDRRRNVNDEGGGEREWLSGDLERAIGEGIRREQRQAVDVHCETCGRVGTVNGHAVLHCSLGHGLMIPFGRSQGDHR